MKFLKILFFVILVIILVFVVLGLIGPKQYDVNRSISIDAPVENVYRHVSTLEKMQAWEPWSQTDPTNKVTYHGTDGEPGAYSRWEGERTGVGERQLVNLIPNERVDTEIRFIEPEFMAGTSDGYFKLDEKESSTEVTWGFSGENGFMFRAFSMIPGMDMESNVGPAFEEGLKMLKDIVESEYAEEKDKPAPFEFAVVDRPATTYLAKRDRIPMSGMSEFMSQHFPQIAMAVATSGSEITGNATGMYFEWNEEEGMTDMATAFPVSAASAIQGYEVVDMPPHKAVRVRYEGGYAGSGQAHQAIDTYMQANNLEMDGPAIEEYIVGPADEPDSNLWVTEIFYQIK